MQKEQEVRGVLKVIQERMVILEDPDRLGCRDSKERRGKMDPEVLQDLKEKKRRRNRMANPRNPNLILFINFKSLLLSSI